MLSRYSPFSFLVSFVGGFFVPMSDLSVFPSLIGFQVRVSCDPFFLHILAPTYQPVLKKKPSRSFIRPSSPLLKACSSAPAPLACSPRRSGIIAQGFKIFNDS